MTQGISVHGIPHVRGSRKRHRPKAAHATPKQRRRRRPSNAELIKQQEERWT